MYIRAGDVRKNYNVSVSTLANWANQGKVRFIRPGRNRYYHKEDISVFCRKRSYNQKQGSTVCYARVSTNRQKEDLDYQCNTLATQFPGADVISDIGSGLDWDRKGFRKLLELMYDGSVAKVVVEYKDRICKFGFELFEWICEKRGVELVVLNQSAYADEYSPNELSEDLLTIINQSTAKNNISRELTGKGKQHDSKPQNINLFNTVTEKKVEAIARNAQLHSCKTRKVYTNQENVFAEPLLQDRSIQ